MFEALVELDLRAEVQVLVVAFIQLPVFLLGLCLQEGFFLPLIELLRGDFFLSLFLVRCLPLLDQFPQIRRLLLSVLEHLLELGVV